MRKFLNSRYTIRVILGVAIMVHGLIRIFFTKEYLELVYSYFGTFAVKEVLLLIALLIPFLEFLIGSLLIAKINVSVTSFIALIISFAMITGMIMADFSIYILLYHTIIIALLTYILLVNNPLFTYNNLIDSPKSKINTRL